MEPEPAFDEKSCRELVEIAVGLLNDGAAAIVRAASKKATGGDEALADEAAKSVRMTEKIQTAVTTGAVECAKKYAIRLDYAPEVMLGGGLILWAGHVGMVLREQKALGALRARAAA